MTATTPVAGDETNAYPAILVHAVLKVIGREAELLWKGEDLGRLLE
jgi:hypothetical protein